MIKEGVSDHSWVAVGVGGVTKEQIEHTDNLLPFLFYFFLNFFLHPIWLGSSVMMPTLRAVCTEVQMKTSIQK